MGDELEAIKANAEEFRARYEAVVEKFGAMQERIDKLEDEKSFFEDDRRILRDQLKDAVEAAECAEKERDERTNDRDVAVEDLRDARQATLEFLRKIEIGRIGNWLCPSCNQVWIDTGKRPVHKVDCELKLLIYRLDMDLNKPAYAMTAKK